jgi:uncharacterized membrane protein
MLEAQTIILFSLWKTYVGPALGAGFGMSYLEAISYTLLGASITIVSAIYFQHPLTRLSKQLIGYWPGRTAKSAATFNPRLRKTLLFYRRYGFWGLMLLTPILFGLPIGTWLALRLGSSPTSVTTALLTMAFGWSTLSYFLVLNGIMPLAS